MKRSTMKSDFALQSKTRPEGRLFPRRKVATKPQVLNGVGDFEMELSLAIQESLKYAQGKDGDHVKDRVVQVDSCDRGNEQKSKVNDDRTRAGDSKTAVVSKNLSSAMATDRACVEEVGRLKDLLLAQGELIQCQQDEILKKDKEIRSLCAERDALECRLQRMERRLSILKQKEEAHDAQQKLAEETVLKSPLRTEETKQASVSRKRELMKRRKRRTWLTIKKQKCKRQRMRDNSAGAASSEKENEEESIEASTDDSNTEDSEESGNESHESDEDNKETENTEEEVKEEPTLDYPMLQTETLYHLYYPKHLCPSPDSKKLQEKAASQLEVETPSWRLNPLTNMYQLEGTENITDEAYFKRHQKFEMEEKRRKRWDMQRLRELRLLEKMERQKEDEMRASQDEVDVETFLPSLHDLTHIEVTASLPVMAFGQPVPYVSPAEFEIPWDMTESGTSTSNRQKNHGAHSKRH